MRNVRVVTDVGRSNGTQSLTGANASTKNAARLDYKSAMYGITKRIFDIFVSVCALAVLFPIISAVSILLLLTQGGPILISHRRVGKYGTVFPCMKFRTTALNSDEVLARHLAAHPDIKDEWEVTRKLETDPRVTAFGQRLRKSSMDEIPQLLNVIRGDMSLVGPRPITMSEAELYGARISSYTSVQPGLTGLWQVSGIGDASYARRVELDTRYAEERSLIGDFIIIARTIFSMGLTNGRC